MFKQRIIHREQIGKHEVKTFEIWRDNVLIDTVKESVTYQKEVFFQGYTYKNINHLMNVKNNLY